LKIRTCGKNEPKTNLKTNLAMLLKTLEGKNSPGVYSLVARGSSPPRFRRQPLGVLSCPKALTQSAQRLPATSMLENFHAQRTLSKPAPASPCPLWPGRINTDHKETLCALCVNAFQPRSAKRNIPMTRTIFGRTRPSDTPRPSTNPCPRGQARYIISPLRVT
jgi:hypothetical protein